jgi:peptidoglycan/xylan/chitin deacetylase (PgdA/CDA1 family)
MSSFVLKSIYTVAYYSGILNLFYKMRKTPIVVSYHNIIPDEIFEKNRQFIGGDHRESEFDQHIAIIKSKLEVCNDIQPGKVLITFDDGYKNNQTVALPILKRHGVSATFFIPASYFDSTEILWVDKMLMWLSFVPLGSYSLAQETYSIESHADREQVWDLLWARLLDNFSLKNSLLEDMTAHHPFADLPLEADYRVMRFEALGREDIDTMKMSGNKIGCHSYNHDILSRLSAEELRDNFNKCEKHRDQYNVDWFSYPFGRANEVNDRVTDQCKESGYSCAFMNIDGFSDDTYRMTRINLPNSVNKAVIHAKLSGFEANLKRLLSR